jgi:hypothetical protein
MNENSNYIQKTKDDEKFIKTYENFINLIKNKENALHMNLGKF